jgi:transketolase
MGWLTMVSGSTENTLCIGLDHFGASAPAEVLAEKFGLTPSSVVGRVKEFFNI